MELTSRSTGTAIKPSALLSTAATLIAPSPSLPETRAVIRRNESRHEDRNLQRRPVDHAARKRDQIAKNAPLGTAGRGAIRARVGWAEESSANIKRTLRQGRPGLPCPLSLRRGQDRLPCLLATGSYRLARLAAKFGPEISLRDLAERFSCDCLWRAEPRPRSERKHYKSLRAWETIHKRPVAAAYCL
jgi:hypothetical protein